METMALTSLVDQHLQAAKDATSGRSSLTVCGGRDHSLRQTLIALRAGQTLNEHESPGEATLQVLRGRVAVVSDDDTTQVAAGAASGDYLVVPSGRHRVDAIDDSAFLLTVAMSLE